MRITEFFSSEIRYLNQRVGELMLENGELKKENEKLKEDLANLQEKYDLVLKLYSKYGTTKNTDKTKSDFIYRM